MRQGLARFLLQRHQQRFVVQRRGRDALGIAPEHAALAVLDHPPVVGDVDCRAAAAHAHGLEIARGLGDRLDDRMRQMRHMRPIAQLDGRAAVGVRGGHDHRVDAGLGGPGADAGGEVLHGHASEIEHDKGHRHLAIREHERLGVERVEDAGGVSGAVHVAPHADAGPRRDVAHCNGSFQHGLSPPR
jgi:hypothetical protein